MLLLGKFLCSSLPFALCIKTICFLHRFQWQQQQQQHAFCKSIKTKVNFLEKHMARRVVLFRFFCPLLFVDLYRTISVDVQCVCVEMEQVKGGGWQKQKQGSGDRACV